MPLYRIGQKGFPPLPACEIIGLRAEAGKLGASGMTIDSPWVDGLTIGDVLARTACQFSDREAVVFPFTGYRTTYEQFSNEVDQTARSLLALGVEPGHHIGIWAANCPEWILIQFAAARVGAVLVNVNPAYRSHELSYVL